MNYFFGLKFGLKSKNKWPLVASVLVLSLISLPPPPFQLDVDQMYASMLILEEQSLHLKCTLSVGTFAINTIHEGRNPNSSCQTLKSACQPTSSWKEYLKRTMPPAPKFASFIKQKMNTPPFYCHSDFFAYTHQLLNVWGQRLSFHQNLVQW